MWEEILWSPAASGAPIFDNLKSADTCAEGGESWMMPTATDKPRSTSG
jgi:hypothetical protein